MKKRTDLIPTKVYNTTIQNYGVGTERYPNNQQVGSPAQAKELAAFKSGQSYNQGKSYNEAQKARHKAGRYGNTPKQETQEGQRSSSPW